MSSAKAPARAGVEVRSERPWDSEKRAPSMGLVWPGRDHAVAWDWEAGRENVDIRCSLIRIDHDTILRQMPRFRFSEWMCCDQEDRYMPGLPGSRAWQGARVVEGVLTEQTLGACVVVGH